MGKVNLKKYLQSVLSVGKKLFIPYIMAGDGGLDALEERINFLSACGVSAIELGIPFSDPVADGPVIQRAGIRALKNGTTLEGVLERLKAFKESRTVPVIIMTYLNPVFQYGLERFARDAEEAGVSGIIIPDVPLEEEGLISGVLRKYGIAHIRLVALTSPEKRAKEIAVRSEGFLYAVSVMGTTGTREKHDAEVGGYLRKLKKISPVPVLAGFGVSNAEQARNLSSFCDGVIVGSKIVQLFNEGKREEIRRLIMDSVSVGMNV